MSPLRRARDGDSISRETQFAGLPKSAMMFLSGSQTLAVGTQVASYDTVSWNDGPFVPSVYPGFPALFQGWIINEPGVYDIQAQIGVNSVNQFVRHSLNTPAGNTVENAFLANNTAGIDTQQFRAPIKCKAGDLVSVITTVSVVCATFATYQWLYIEKKGGQY